MDYFELPRNRRFQVWNYSVSHSWLLLRSNKSDFVPTRIEILFYDVAAMHLPTLIDDMIVGQEDAMADSTTRLLDGLTTAWQPDIHRLFTLRGKNCFAYVLAGGVECHEDFLSFSDPSHFST